MYLFHASPSSKPLIIQGENEILHIGITIDTTNDYTEGYTNKYKDTLIFENLGTFMFKKMWCKMVV